MNNRYGKLPYKVTPYGIANRRANIFRAMRASSILAMGLAHSRVLVSQGWPAAVALATNHLNTVKAVSESMKSIVVINRKVVMKNEPV